MRSFLKQFLSSMALFPQVMSRINCCVHTMIFHDFFFPGVMQAIKDNGIVSYFGKSWKHLGMGFPNLWGLDSPHAGGNNILRVSWQRSRAQCPKGSEEDRVGEEQRGEQEASSDNASDSLASASLAGAVSEVTRSLHPVGQPASKLWSANKRYQTMNDLLTFYPTHPEALLVRLKDKFISHDEMHHESINLRSIADHQSAATFKSEWQESRLVLALRDFLVAENARGAVVPDFEPPPGSERLSFASLVEFPTSENKKGAAADKDTTSSEKTMKRAIYAVTK